MGSPIAVQLSTDKIQEDFFATLRSYSSAIGFFVKKEIMLEHELLGSTPEFIIEQVDGFFSKVGTDGRIYLPASIVKKHNIKHHNIVFIKSITGERAQKLSLVTVRKKKSTTEYRCNFNNQVAGTVPLFLIENLSLKKRSYSHMMQQVLKKFKTAPLNDSQTVLFLGNRIPIIINDKIKIEDSAYYLGAFFADGTKRGNNWGICASTFKQAKYYLSMHEKFIADATLNISLTYTDNKNEDLVELRKRLARVWLDNAAVSVNPGKIRVIGTLTPDAANRNQYGSLVIKELRQSTMFYYNELLDYLLKKMCKTRNKKLALRFLSGVLEGDGFPSAHTRGHIVISTNKCELGVLREVFNIAGLKHEGLKEGKNKASIRIGSLEILKNLLSFNNSLFTYYPKRRKRFIERFLSIGVTRYLLGKQKATAYWVVKELQREKIIDKSNSLTKKGKRIQSVLLEMEKSVTVL